MSAAERATLSGCAFCAIAAGHATARIVVDDGNTVAFLDRRPLFPGHVLLVPTRHVATLGDLPDALVQPLFTQAKRLARAVQRGLEADGSFVAINNRVSQSVLHLHVHIVPRRRGDGLRGFFWPRHGYRDDAHADAVLQAIQRALDEDER